VNVLQLLKNYGKEGFRFFMERDIFFVYHNVTQCPNIYDFLKNRFSFAEKKPKS